MADYDQAPVRGLEHVDRRRRRAGVSVAARDHLARGSRRDPAGGEIHHAVQSAPGSGSRRGPPSPRSRRRRGRARDTSAAIARLVRQVEAVQRLVQQQQAVAARPTPGRSAGAAARRRTADRSGGPRRRSRRPGDHLAHAVPLRPGPPARAPGSATPQRFAVEPEPDNVDPAHPQLGSKLRRCGR